MTDSGVVRGSRTHEVTNQPPPRVDIDEYTTNQPLREAVRSLSAGWADAGLLQVGRLVGSAEFQHDAEVANVHVPVLHTHDRWGRRSDEVAYHPAYHRVLAAAVHHGAHTSAWAEPRPGANVARAATFMLFAQVEPGHACPVSMTHAAVPTILLAPDQLADRWLPRLLSREYDGRLGPGGTKAGALIGMAMTEKQGGSDVRANSTVAVDAGGEEYLLTGHKWFCSAPMSDAFLVLARAHDGRTAQGLSCFLVPRVLDDGSRNVFRIQRLKDKLGNRSNASAEIELDGTVGALVGEPGRGVRTIIEMVQRTRLDCVLGTAAGMRQSVAEALWHARHRRAFGSRLVDAPAMTGVLVDLALESEAATLTAMRLAAAYDSTDASEVAFRRIATAVVKYWVCKRGPNHAYEAMECLGGNGYTEAFPLARRYREQPVLAIWEGSGNVVALDVLRALTREPDTLVAFEEELARSSGANPLLDGHVDRLAPELHRVAAEPSEAEARARGLVERMALALQASVMLRLAPTEAAETFISTRLGADRRLEYGALPAGIDAEAILHRH